MKLESNYTLLVNLSTNLHKKIFDTSAIIMMKRTKGETDIILTLYKSIYSIHFQLALCTSKN